MKFSSNQVFRCLDVNVDRSFFYNFSKNFSFFIK